MYTYVDSTEERSPLKAWTNNEKRLEDIEQVSDDNDLNSSTLNEDEEWQESGQLVPHPPIHI